MKRTVDGYLRWTLVLEFGGPFQIKPGVHSESMYRFWWLWFAVGALRVPFKEFCETRYFWIKEE